MSHSLQDRSRRVALPFALLTRAQPCGFPVPAHGVLDELLRVALDLNPEPAIITAEPLALVRPEGHPKGDADSLTNLSLEAP